jgi:23S rRNA pseudouridine2605 synthase
MKGEPLFLRHAPLYARHPRVYTHSGKKAWMAGASPAPTKNSLMSDKTPSQTPGERIAKVIARAGLASRREAEIWIAAGRVSVNGAVISSPALNVTPSDRIEVDEAPLRPRERTRLFLYHKPRGLVTTHSDPEGRDTIFRALPKGLPRLISIGRLDINTEGLLLLTNDGGLARILELPATGWLRRYRVRALGRVRQEALDRLRGGITVEGIHYGPIQATLDREQGANVWLTFGIREGKNREVRKVLETLGLKVNRLIRVGFGPFELGDLNDGAVKEVDTSEMRAKLGDQIIADAGADFDAPLFVEEAKAPPRRSGTRAKDRETGVQRGKSQPTPKSSRHAGAQGRNDNRKFHRRDRTGGPRPKYPKPRA